MKSKKSNSSHLTDLDKCEPSIRNLQALTKVQIRAKNKSERVELDVSGIKRSFGLGIQKSPQQPATEQAGNGTRRYLHTCSGCNKLIKKDRYLLKASDKYWHENCLRCDKCHRRLAELGPTFFCKSEMNLCQRDYLE